MSGHQLICSETSGHAANGATAILSLQVLPFAARDVPLAAGSLRAGRWRYKVLGDARADPEGPTLRAQHQ